MSWTIGLMWMILLTTIAGTILTALWYPVGKVLEKAGFLNVKYVFLKMILGFWFVPVAYLLFKHIHIERWEGALFVKTPALQIASLVFCIIWGIGFAFFMWRYLSSEIRIFFLRIHAFACEVEKVALFEKVCEELNIRKGKVRVLQSYSAIVPMLVGPIRPVVIIPTDDVTEEMLRVYYVHELTHYLHRDTGFKNLTGFVFCFHFFNPLMWLYRDLIGKWGEYACDLDAYEKAGGLAVYFQVIVRLMLLNNVKLSALMPHLFGKKKENMIVERVNRVVNNMNRKRKPKWMIVIFAAVSVIISTVTVSAASYGTAEGYVALYNLTNVEAVEDVEPMETQEFEDTLSDEDYEIIVEQLPDENLRTVKQLNWTVGTKTLKVSSSFFKFSGSTITVSGVIDPSDLTAYVGIVEPDGTKRCIMTRGGFTHTFQLDQTGFYSIYVRNANSSSSIQVGMSYSY